MEEAPHVESHARGLHGTLDAKTENLVLFLFSFSGVMCNGREG